MSEHTESLKVWLCSECGEQKELASCTWKSLFPSVSADLAIPHHSHGRRSEQRWVPAEEVEVIPAAESERRVEAVRDALRRHGEHSPLCAQLTREEICDCGLREALALSAPGVADGFVEANRAIADLAAEQESPHDS